MESPKNSHIQVEKEKIAYLAGVFDSKTSLRLSVHEYRGKLSLRMPVFSSSKKLLETICRRFSIQKNPEKVKYLKGTAYRVVFKEEEYIMRDGAYI